MKILCGIQPTGKIHLGNYLGTLKKAIEMQEEHDVVFLIADIHAITTNHPSLEVVEGMLAELKSLGAKKVILQNKEMLHLFFTMLCNTSVGELKRMTQFKDKGEGNAGLFTYPVLMAADIYADDYDAVIVGDDQKQHMELAARIGRKMGYKERQAIYTETPRIMSIADPTIKMSKSKGDKHCIYLFDDPEVNAKKIMKAPTCEAGMANLENISRGLGTIFDPDNCYESKLQIINAISSL